jgi:hypothetical protein
MTTIKQQSGTNAIEYRISEYLGSVSIEVRVNGKRHTEGQPAPTSEVVQGKQMYGRINNVFFSRPDVWAEVWTAYNATKEQVESSDEYKTRQLRQQRERLAYDLKYAHDDLHETQQRKVEAAMQGQAYRYDVDKLEAEIAAAKAALAAFDEAHPEIIAVIRKERDERTERNMWN